MALSLDEALGMSLVDEADESIHVGIDTRQVTIPESQQVFGVESDEDVEVKHIVIDGRYNDGTDLSTFTFRVNYQNANGDKGTYLATELKVNDDSIEFDWVIGRQVVAYKGTIAFIVCAYTIDSSSVIQNEWNSTLGKGTVLEGLEVSEFDFGDDIVRQLASILSDVNAAQASAKASADEAYKSKTEVVALGKEQQAAIEKKGKDTLASIPDNYTQVSNDVSQLKEATAKLKDGKISKFYASSQGNTNLPDSDDGRIMDLKLYGKSSQQQYSGKNLLNATLGTTSKNGVTCTANADGTYTISGTATADTLFIIANDINFTEARKIVGCPSGMDTKKAFLQLNSSELAATDIGNGAAITPSTNVVFDMRIAVKSGFATSNLIFKPMITTDMSATYADFEPYVGGIPSPNPEYPQEIKSVVNPVVTISDGADKQQTVTLPYTLNAIPVTSGGNVTIDGQQYIADYVDVERGKLVRMVDSSKLDTTQSIIGKTDWLLATPTETDLTADEIAAFKVLVSHYPVTNVSTTSDQLDGYTVFNYPISLAKGYDYLKTQLGDTRDYLYGIDLMTAEAYVNSEYAAALAEIEV